MSVVFAVCAATAGAVVAWGLNRAEKQSAPIPLPGLVRRLGLSLDQMVRHASGEQLAQAARRCGECRNAAACQGRLAGGDVANYETYCPNAVMITTLRRRIAADA